MPIPTRPAAPAQPQPRSTYSQVPASEMAPVVARASAEGVRRWSAGPSSTGVPRTQQAQAADVEMWCRPDDEQVPASQPPGTTESKAHTGAWDSRPVRWVVSCNAAALAWVRCSSQLSTAHPFELLLGGG
jgi:hypothetical protein